MTAKLSDRARRALARLTADRCLWLALLLTVPVMAPLFAPGYFYKAHDARHSVYYLIEFDRAFRAGALWPVWGPDFAVGFGYPLWLIYAPLAYFVGQGFHLLGLSFTAATKASWALGFVLGSLGVYRLARRWWGPAAGLVASVAFTYAPYHLVDIYVRAALAEFMALGWLPWVMLALAALWDAPGPRRAVAAAGAIAALLMLHTVSMLTFVPLIVGLPTVLWLRDLAGGRSRSQWLRALGWTVAAGALGGLLAAIFLVPMLLERSYIAEAQWISATYNYRNHFVYPLQFLNPAWGFGYSAPGPDDGMSFQLGLAIIPIAAAGAVAALNRRATNLPHRFIAVFLVLLSIGTLFMMTPASAPVWDALPLVEMVQFPWRLLAVEAFTLALLAGLAAQRLEQRPLPARTRRLATAGLAAALLLASLPYVRAQLVPVEPWRETPLAVFDFELNFKDMRAMTRWSERTPLDEDSPLIAQYLAGEPLRRAAIVAGEGRVIAQEARALSADATVQADGPVRLRFYTYYFPGWRGTVDGRPVELAPDPPNGLIGLDLPAGEHQVTVRFGPTPVRAAAAGLSGLGLLVAAALLLAERGRNANWKAKRSVP